VIDELLKKAGDKMDHAVEHTVHEFGSVRTGRANPGLLQRVTVDYYGTQTPLQQLANFSVPDARMLVVQPYDKSAITAMERAIQAADLGLNPSNDGNVIRLAFPSLTEERRHDLIKVVHRLAEDGRVAVRNVRRHSKDAIEAEDALARKEEELLEV